MATCVQRPASVLYSDVHAVVARGDAATVYHRLTRPSFIRLARLHYVRTFSPMPATGQMHRFEWTQSNIFNISTTPMPGCGIENSEKESGNSVHLH